MFRTNRFNNLFSTWEVFRREIKEYKKVSQRLKDVRKIWHWLKKISDFLIDAGGLKSIHALQQNLLQSWF